MVLNYFFKNHSKSQLESMAIAFTMKRIPDIVRPAAMNAIEKAKAEGSEVAIVSASVDIWLAPFCKKYDLKLICTKANFVNGIFSGTFASLNCNGKEKARRIKEVYDLSEFDKVIAYGDTEGDRAMFEIADEFHFKPFREKEK